MNQLPFAKISESLDNYENALKNLYQSLLSEKASQLCTFAFFRGVKPLGLSLYWLMFLPKQDSTLSEERLLEILLTRDRVKNAFDNCDSAPTWSLIHLDKLDKLLKEKKKKIINNIPLEHWRSLVNPPDSSWWWFLDRAWQNQWFWNLLSISFLTVSAGLVTNISSRFLIGNPDLLGSIAVIGQGVLTIVTGKTALTLAGKEGIEKLSKNFKFIKYSWWNPIRCASAFLLMSGLLLFYYFLPKLSQLYADCGISDFKGEPPKHKLFCRTFLQTNQQKNQFYTTTRKRLTNAQNNFQRAIELDPNNMEAHYYLGFYHEKVGEMKKAQTEYEIAAQGGYLFAINNLSYLYILDKKYDQAINLLIDNADLTKIKGTRVEYFLKKNRGWAYLELGLVDEAKKDLDRVLDLELQVYKNDNSPPDPYCLMAIFYEKNSEKLSQNEIKYWSKCKDLNQKRKLEQRQWFIQAEQKLTQAQKQGLIP